MNLQNNPSLMDQLAASYALGTLRGGARRRFEALARDNAPLRAAALIWQGRLASVAELQAQEAPSPAVWKRIENLVKADKEARAMQAARAATPAAAAGGLWASLGLWRGGAAAGAIATVAAVVVGLNVNGRLSGQVSELTAKLTATPAIEYVAVLTDDKASASLLVTFDPKNKSLVLKRVGNFREPPDKSLELWALPAAAGVAPKSLGVMGSDGVARLKVADTDMRQVPGLAITLEPKGGVPPGTAATGPLLFKGALIETPK
ncbi:MULTISPECIES: anti-sigma factor domain-containing protein [unclassified Polaromonas]|uniref:anti-sigma factor n=1 Tax=unclassified Polaromonas TaxID=2638319 RepID=UPI000F07C8FE|nr:MULTISPECIES: anti-sigma factor [unclassified Polaromonas]AYQ26713.1 RNA polymerase subunit sigma-70 [Polaromonas sp. SP1]QGJ18442.1 RNA polymerase subunit sigma-70 [Polaromonas sp. Pch-P]